MDITAEIPNIISTMRRYWPVSQESMLMIFGSLKRFEFPRKHLLVGEGFTSGRAYFIERGMTRSYWMENGQEITTSFSTEGAIVFSMDEMYSNLPSEEYVETVEPVTAYAITTVRLQQLVTSRLDLANWWSKLHEYEYRRIHRSHKERLTLDAVERYDAFATQFPEVCRRARLTDIASYLGITPSTLSRIRARVKNR